MGFFAFFVGTLYNDFASLPIEFFGGSCYAEGSNIQTEGCVYPWGIDHRWY